MWDHNEGRNGAGTLADTWSQACLTRAWSTDSFPSGWTGCSSGSACFFFISNWTWKCLKTCRTKEEHAAEATSDSRRSDPHLTPPTWYLSDRFPSDPWALSTSFSSWSKKTFSSLNIFLSSLCHSQTTSTFSSWNLLLNSMRGKQKTAGIRRELMVKV